MSVARLRPVLLGLVLVGSTAPVPGVAQIAEGAPPARLISFITEPREPELGEIFDLTVTVRISPDVIALFPDTLLPTDSTASAGRGSWAETEGPTDSTDVRATFPVMAFVPGGVWLPSLEVHASPSSAN